MCESRMNGSIWQNEQLLKSIGSLKFMKWQPKKGVKHPVRRPVRVPWAGILNDTVIRVAWVFVSRGIWWTLGCGVGKAIYFFLFWGKGGKVHSFGGGGRWLNFIGKNGVIYIFVQMRYYNHEFFCCFFLNFRILNSISQNGRIGWVWSLEPAPKSSQTPDLPPLRGRRASYSPKKNSWAKDFFAIEPDPSNVLLEVELLVFNKNQKNPGANWLNGMANTIYPFTRQYPEHPRGRTAVSRRAPARRSP